MAYQAGDRFRTSKGIVIKIKEVRNEPIPYYEGKGIYYSEDELDNYEHITFENKKNKERVKELDVIVTNIGETLREQDENIGCLSDKIRMFRDEYIKEYNAINSILKRDQHTLHEYFKEVKILLEYERNKNNKLNDRVKQLEEKFECLSDDEIIKKVKRIMEEKNKHKSFINWLMFWNKH